MLVLYVGRSVREVAVDVYLVARGRVPGVCDCAVGSAQRDCVHGRGPPLSRLQYAVVRAGPDVVARADCGRAVEHDVPKGVAEVADPVERFAVAIEQRVVAHARVEHVPAHHARVCRPTDAIALYDVVLSPDHEDTVIKRLLYLVADHLYTAAAACPGVRAGGKVDARLERAVDAVVADDARGRVGAAVLHAKSPQAVAYGVVLDLHGAAVAEAGRAPRTRARGAPERCLLRLGARLVMPV